MVHSAAPPRKIAATQSHRPLLLKYDRAPDSFSGVVITGIVDLKKKNNAAKGIIKKKSTRYCQFSEPKRSRNRVVMRMTSTTPQAYTEWSLLISRSGSSAGIDAINGLIKTSHRPLDAEKITVPMTNPMYMALGKI